MNTQLKELLDWAKDHARIYVIECELANIPVVQEEYDRRFQEMFAELIVRECADVIAPMGDWCGGHGEPSMPSTMECAKRLKQHFGVEE